MNTSYNYADFIDMTIDPPQQKQSRRTTTGNNKPVPEKAPGYQSEESVQQKEGYTG